MTMTSLRILVRRAAEYAAAAKLPAPGNDPRELSATVEHAIDHPGSPEAHALLAADDAFASESASLWN